MSPLLPRRSSLVALACTVFGALIIGCGGGGGGGGNSTNSTTSTTSTDTGGTNPTTTSGAAGSIGGGTDGGTGALTPNAIYYLTVNPTAGYDVKYTNEAGTAAGTYATGVTDLAPYAVSPDPSSSGRLVFAAPATSSSSTLGIYRNTSATTAGATTIVTPRYSEIDSLQVSRDGTKVVFVAATASDATPHLYVVPTSGSGTPTLLDGDYIISADLSSTGNLVVYEKLPSTGSTELYVRDLSATAPVQFTNDAFDQDEPQFSKDGSKIVFSQDDGTGRHVLGLLSSAGGTITKIDPFPGTAVSVRAPSFNSAGTRIAFVAEGDQTTNSGVFTCDATGANLTQVPGTYPPSPLPSLYWTNAGGRAVGNLWLHLNRPRTKK